MYRCMCRYGDGFPTIAQQGEVSVLLQPIRELQQEQRKLCGMCTAIVESKKRVVSVVEELKTLVSNQEKNFSVKGTAYEVNLTSSYNVYFYSSYYYVSYH